MTGEQFYNKNVTVRRVNNTFVKGICIRYDTDGITLKISEFRSDREVFVPREQILEIITENNGGG